MGGRTAPALLALCLILAIAQACGPAGRWVAFEPDGAGYRLSLIHI